MPQLSRLVLALVPLLVWTAAAEPSSERERKERSVTLSAAPIEIRVAPGTITTLAFDANLDRQSVEMDRTRFALVDVGERTINLEPVAELTGGVGFRVRFADAVRLGVVVFSLATHPSEVDSQVRVFREVRTPEALQAQVAALEARCSACESELAAQRERARASGPAGMVIAKHLGTKGVSAVRLQSKSSAGAGGLRAGFVRRYLSEEWVVLEVEVENLSSHQWRAETAWVERESDGRRFEARTVVMAPEALLPGGAGLVAVEFSGPPGQPGEPFRLVMLVPDGNRAMSITGVLLRDGAQEKSP
ncbi:DUF2381 family protein [Pyxidicoccus sp. 3LFB2]